MLSGRLNLRTRRDSELPDYYYRKFTRILMPTLVFIFLQSTYEQISDSGAKLGQGLIARAFIANAIGDYSGDVHWFVMALFGMLLAAPIIAPMVEDMTPGRRKAFIVLFLLFSAPPILLCRTNHSFEWKYQLSGFFGLFIYGAMVDLDRLAYLEKWKIVIPTLTCIAISSTLLFLGFPHSPVNDNTPMYYIAGVGLLALLYGWGKNMKPCSLVSLIAKHSFGIYLCHFPILKSIAPLFSWAAMPFRHLLITASALALAFGFAWLVDSFLITNMQKITDRLWEMRHSSGA